MAAEPSLAISSPQAGQSALISLMDAPIQSAFLLLDPSNPESLQQYVTTVTALTHYFGKASAAGAASSYETERKAAGVPGLFTARLAPAAPLEKIDRSVRWATQDLWLPEPDVEATRSKLTGVIEKNVLDTGRHTTLNAVHLDRMAKGWAREPEPGACSFCALLATRGAVYKSEQSGGFRSHDHCRCICVPVFNAYEPSAQIREWQQIYKESKKGVHGPAATRKAFRSALEARSQ